MRDIRNDLQERLHAISHEREAIQVRLNELTQLESGVKSLYGWRRSVLPI